MGINDNIFARNQVSLDMKRSRFSIRNQNKTSFNAGDLIPLYFEECLPGDTVSMDTSFVIRMPSPVIDPIMDNIYMDVYWFFVPYNIIWEHAKQFFGENDSQAWNLVTNKVLPPCKSTDTYAQLHYASSALIGRLGDYFNLLYAGDESNIKDTDLPNELPLRAYYKIANYWFRNPNVVAPTLFTLGDTANTNITYRDAPYKVSRFRDVVTTALPEPQRGPAVSMNIGGTIPVKTIDPDDVITSYLNPTEPLVWAQNSGGVASLVKKTDLSEYTIFGLGHGTGSGDNAASTGIKDTAGNSGSYTDGIIPANLAVDLSKATMATINQIRNAFALQRYYEKSARGGNKYQDYVKAFFGVDLWPGYIQEPEYLSGHRVRLNVDQVLSHSSATNGDESSVLGETGAYSLTSDKYSYFTKSFTQHGLLMCVGCVRYDNTYADGCDPFFMKKEVFDIYNPTFANVGEFPVSKRTFSIYGTDSDGKDNVLGYQEAWNQSYRSKMSRCSGYLNPNITTGGLGHWTLARSFASEPSLNKALITCDGKELDRALYVGSDNIHQFIGDFYFDATWSRVMPIESVPGLIDHH